MLKKIYNRFLSVISTINKDEIFVYSAQSSYYIIVSSIPFMMLFLSVLKYIVPFSESEVINMMKPLIPQSLFSPIRQMIHDLYNKSGALVSITTVTAIWSASRGVAAVERGVKKVYKVKSGKSVVYDVLISLLYTLLFMIVLFLSLLVMVFGKQIYAFTSTRLTWVSRMAYQFGGYREVLYFLALFIIFAMAYKVFAGKGSKFREHIIGAIFSTSGWFLFSYIFSLYVENYPYYSYIYGGLAMLVLLMLWLYSCTIILLLGAEINVYFMNRK